MHTDYTGTQRVHLVDIKKSALQMSQEDKYCSITMFDNADE